MNGQIAIGLALPSPTASKSTFLILPAGAFKSADGRPTGGDWFLTAQRGAQLVAAAEARNIDYVIDYEHQTLASAENGKPAPAAGWFRKLQWREDGLYIIDARWNQQAREMLDTQQYRYVSPVFSYDRKTFEVLSLQSVALTNTPGLHGLTDLATLKIGANASKSLLGTVSQRDLSRMQSIFGESIYEDTEAALQEEASLNSQQAFEEDRETIRNSLRGLGLNPDF